jgi:SPP1 gp7 family putative phage head morphogenesis protein
MHLVERMQVAVIGLVNAYFDRLMREIEPALRRRFDAAAFPIGDVGGQVSLGEHFLQTTFRMVDRQAAADLSRVIPVPSDTVLKGAAHLEAGFIRNNTELIQLDQRAREEVRKVIEGPLREGIRVEEVRKLIEERLGIVRSRAILIARDQTTKLYGQIQEARQTEAGVVEYTWSTSEDERVRGTPGGKWPKGNHFQLDGTTQRWDSPPLVDQASGRHAHPGGDIQCRCAAIPILPLDGLEAPDNPPEPGDITPPEPGNDVTAPPDNDVSLPEVEFASELASPPANDLDAELHAAAEQAAAERLAAEQAALEAELRRLEAEQKANAPPAERAKSFAKEYATVGNVPREVEESLTRTIEKVRPAQTPALDRVEIHEGESFVVERAGAPPARADGLYNIETQSLRVAASPVVEGLPLADTNYTTGASAQTAAEAMARLATHEYAHHVHLTGGPDVDRAIQRAYETLAPLAATTELARRGLVDPDNPPEGSVSVYGTQDRWEFWAEAFTAYHFDRAWMLAHKPGAFALVELVLRLLR